MIEFIKKIFHKWFGIFSLIASASGVLLFYTGIDTNSIIVSYFKHNWLTISLIFLLVSSYQVWLDMKNKKIELEDKLKNPVDYEIKGYQQNIAIDVDYLENLFDEEIRKLDKLLLDVDDEIKKLFVDDDLKTTNISKNFSIHSTFMSHNNFKSDESYIQELKNYKTKLEEYPNKKESFLLNWKIFIDNELKNIYFVSFTIKNIGTVSDEDIDIEISHNKKYIVDLYNLDTFPKKPSLPKKPTRESITFIQPRLDHHLNLMKMSELTRDLNPMTYRRYEEINDNKFSIKLKDLKVSEEVDIFRKNGFFMYVENENDFNVNIVSKKSNAAIQKKVLFQKEKDYNYFESKNA